MRCFVYLSYDNALYTDFHYRDEVSRKKLALIGDGKGYTTHNFDYIKHLESRCDHIILAHPTAVIAPYTFAFEEVINRLTDLNKLIIIAHNDVDTGWYITDNWEHDEPQEDTLCNIRNFVDNFDLSGQMMNASDWHKLFYISWAKLYKIDNRKERWDELGVQCHSKATKPHNKYHKAHLIMRQLEGEARLFDKSRIIDPLALPEYASNIVNFKLMEFKIDDSRQVLGILKELATESNWKITPLSYTPTGVYTPIGICQIMIEKDTGRNLEVLQQISAKWQVEFKDTYWRRVKWNAAYN